MPPDVVLAVDVQEDTVLRDSGHDLRTEHANVGRGVAT